MFSGNNGKQEKAVYGQADCDSGCSYGERIGIGMWLPEILGLTFIYVRAGSKSHGRQTNRSTWRVAKSKRGVLLKI